MLKSRVITAIVLLALLLAALFLLPPMAWALLVVVMVMQGTTEWSHLSKLEGRRASLYWWSTLLLMLGLVALDAYAAGTVNFYVHLAIYLVSALLWLVIVPTWLMVGWKVTNPLAMAAVGWAVLIPTGAADPYALRRHALGIIQILIELDRPLDILQAGLVEGADGEEARLGGRDGRQLHQGRRAAVVFHQQLLDQGGRGAPRADGRQAVLQRTHGSLHARRCFRQGLVDHGKRLLLG